MPAPDRNSVRVQLWDAMESSKRAETAVVLDEKCDFKNLQVDRIDKVQLPPEKISWLITLNELYFHLGTVYAFKLIFDGRVALGTFLTAVIFAYVGGLAITIGAHRLWAHRSFKATTGLRYVLAICQVIAVQASLLQWVTWHRVHHKFSDTKLDPHNASRGFFYSHIGWLLTYNPKLYMIQQRYADMKDLEADPVVMWQDKYYGVLLVLVGLILPVSIPVLFFNEEFATAWYVTVCGRIAVSQNFTFTVNSLAHLYGYQPYDKGIYPRENKFVVALSLGEGWHNYHHTFPWDYRASEFGGSWCWMNLSANIIEFFVKMGWAWDLKVATPALVDARMKRTGAAQ